MGMSERDRTLLRDLAKQVAEVADLPVMAERREMWKRHNSLRRVRPMILVFPEGGWRELLPGSEMTCEDGGARGIEWSLRSRLYYHRHFRDDTVIEKEWMVSKAVSVAGWGLVAKHIPSPASTGAWRFDPVLRTREDFKRMKQPEVRYDEEATRRNYEAAQDLFGDILDVKLKGVSHVSFHIMNIYTGLRGLEQAIWDMVENPSFIHDVLAFLEEGYRGIVRQYVEMNLLSLNNDGTYHSTGGNGYTDELPPPDCDPNRVRPCDMWASAESQEMDPISPAMHEEFALRYERPLLEPFGLTGYACCDDVSHKLDDVCALPHMRRISIAPFADVDLSAEKLQGNFIFSWKPKPYMLVGSLDEDKVRTYIRHTLDVSKECVIEMILKDTHTCENHPERFDRWTEIARDLVERY